MLVGALRSDNPLGGAALTCDEATEAFSLQGIGEISAAKLLDLENRRQLVWSDLVTREWVLETAAIRVRRQTAVKAAAAAVAAAAAASVAAESAPTEAESVTVDDRARVAAPGGHTLIFGPPRPSGRPGPTGLAGSSGLAEFPTASASALQPPAARRPAGVPAATTRFAAPVDDGRVAGRLVWSEAMSDGDAAPREGAASGEVAAPGGGAVPGEVTVPEGALTLAAQVDGRKASAPTAAWTPPTGAPDWPRQAGASGQATVTRQAGATVTRRADRRRSLQKAKQRRRLSVVSGRAVVVALFVVATVVLVLVVQRGGF
jgi:hypothetical protein